MSHTLKAAVARQRMLLHDRLRAPMTWLAAACVDGWGTRDALEQRLRDGLDALPFCKYLYVLDASARQVTGNLSPGGLLPEHVGRDRRHRPYLAQALAGAAFSLSDAYISRNARRPSLTAIQRINGLDGEPLGYLGADFDLRELPLTRELCGQPEQWVQLKGDPSIRGGLFAQQRSDSLMDGCIDDVLDLMTELIAVHGVFHGKLHFSSSRATVWVADDPYRYRLLDFEDLSDPGICLAYTKRDYPTEAAVPLQQVGRGDPQLPRAAFHGREHLPPLGFTEHLQRHGRAQLFLRRVALHAMGGVSAQEPGILDRCRRGLRPRRQACGLLRMHGQGPSRRQPFSAAALGPGALA